MHIPSLKIKLYKTISETRKDIVNKINPERYQYILTSKTPKLSIAKLKEYDLYIPEGADSFRIVNIGKRTDKNYYKTITTYYKNNQIMMRIFNDNGTDSQTRLYQTQKTKVGAIKYIYRMIKTFEQGRSRDNLELKKFEKIEVTKNNNTKSPRYKMHKEENIYDGSQIISKLKEYSVKPSRRPIKHNVELKINIDSDGIPNVIEKNTSNGINLSVNDKFLAYRFIFDNSKKRLAFTNYFLKKYNLNKLNIKIDETENLPNDTAGNFCVQDRLISYDKDSFSTLEIAAHEVRHAYQFAQIGRLGKGRDAYYRDSEKYLGMISDLSEQKEAYKFYNASEKYPSEEDIALDNKLYTYNYLEIDARKAENEAVSEYSKGARILAAEIGRYI